MSNGGELHGSTGVVELKTPDTSHQQMFRLDWAFEKITPGLVCSSPFSSCQCLQTPAPALPHFTFCPLFSDSSPRLRTSYHFSSVLSHSFNFLGRVTIGHLILSFPSSSSNSRLSTLQACPLRHRRSCRITALTSSHISAYKSTTFCSSIIIEAAQFYNATFTYQAQSPHCAQRGTSLYVRISTQRTL